MPTFRCAYSSSRILIALAGGVFSLAACASPSDDGAVDSTEQELIASSIFTFGQNHACARTATGVKCWGGNQSGQLGSGQTGAFSVAKKAVAGLTGVEQLAAGRSHTCARLTNGTVRCWGSNRVGQLGDGTTIDRSSPVDVAGLAGVTFIAAGTFHNCAVLSSGRVKCWGYNSGGQLGTGAQWDTLRRAVDPVDVVGLSAVVDLALGSEHSCARTQSDLVYCWGANWYGQLGDGTTQARPLAGPVAGLTGVKSIAAGHGHNCAITASGALLCWGLNSSGQLGDGTGTGQVLPHAVTLPSLAKRVSAGGGHSCAVVAGGQLLCWGSNYYGEITGVSTGGLGGRNATQPMVVPGISAAVTDVITGADQTCAALANGTVKCLGRNQYGQLGAGTTGGQGVSDVIGL